MTPPQVISHHNSLPPRPLIWTWCGERRSAALLSRFALTGSNGARFARAVPLGLGGAVILTFRHTKVVDDEHPFSTMAITNTLRASARWLLHLSELGA